MMNRKTQKIHFYVIKFGETGMFSCYWLQNTINPVLLDCVVMGLFTLGLYCLVVIPGWPTSTVVAMHLATVCHVTSHHLCHVTPIQPSDWSVRLNSALWLVSQADQRALIGHLSWPELTWPPQHCPLGQLITGLNHTQTCKHALQLFLINL